MSVIRKSNSTCVYLHLSSFPQTSWIHNSYERIQYISSYSWPASEKAIESWALLLPVTRTQSVAHNAANHRDQARRHELVLTISNIFFLCKTSVS
jgi:hypothetical protein